MLIPKFEQFATTKDASSHNCYRILYLAVLVYLASFVFEAPVRFVLSGIGLASVLYLRDLLPMLTIAIVFYHWVIDKKRPLVVLSFIWIICFHSLVGGYYDADLFQRLFGLKIFLPIIFGMAVSYYHPAPRKIVFASFVVAFLFSVFGVFLNYFIQFPWEGQEFNTAFGTTEQSRVWTAGGIRRLSGLSRASFDAASVILLSSTFLLASNTKIFVRLFVFLLGVFAIALTTTKGALLALMVGSVVIFLEGSTKSHRVVRMAFLISAILVALVPLVSLLIDVKQRDIPQEYFWVASSFVDRMEWMWPRAFDLLIAKGNLVFGRGPGGIGVSQLYFEWRYMNAADNIFVYWFVTFGLIGILYFIFFVKKVMGWCVSDISFLGVTMMVVILTYGLTANVFEQPVLAFCFGYLITMSFEKHGLSE